MLATEPPVGAVKAVVTKTPNALEDSVPGRVRSADEEPADSDATMSACARRRHRAVYGTCWGAMLRSKGTLLPTLYLPPPGVWEPGTHLHSQSISSGPTQAHDIAHSQYVPAHALRVAAEPPLQLLSLLALC